jgi:hypothetical protein
MTTRNNLQSFKLTAKLIARAKRIPHHGALNIVATYLKQPNWHALTREWDKGWRPEPEAVEALATAETLIDSDVMTIPVVGIGQGVKEEGVLDGHPYTLEIDFEVVMGGRGWCILLAHAPSEKPVIETYDTDDNNPVRDPKFVEKALVICNGAVERLRARIATDWPRRSTKPDTDGNAQHPLTKGVANEWYCLHCDDKSTGIKMASNMWHCPKCSATPLDIFASPFWRAP